MKYPDAQDPWRGRQPVPPAPAAPSYPAPPTPTGGWWKRIPPVPRALLLLAVPLVLCCCGGFTAIGVFGDDPAAESKADPSTVVSDSARLVDSTPTATPSPSGSPTRARAATPTPAATTTSAAPRRTTSSPRSVYYRNCDAVRAAGKAPLRRGAPGYRAGLDRDGDGVACEPDSGNRPAGGGSTDSVQYRNCAAVRAAGAAPIRRGDPGYGSHLDRDGDGVGCE
ncbi:excalibur calcium-binding domain-containing protein [Micromonospora pattaloongensis]|nr:excalibur calcium-binding domain-containing protein [Micromonospora pattaloongensis]